MKNASSALIAFACAAVFTAACQGAAYCADKNWIGAGDASTWADPKNWNPEGAPTSADDVTIDLEGSSASASETFEAKSVTVGGGNTSVFSTENFVYGEISTASPSDEALYIKKAGTVVLNGAGTITLRGMFKNTEETVTGEESFMFTLE
ncbi:MAG: hypothetical protein PHE80_06710 [Candidatus Omnitrophica bacterium]|nr:hypothetical protein [Candidatus Omnitrophota bacterium]MDD5738051.1 hypothetical protein [Candidatus Omnitrophota bacterium]